jgi:hypothetical protein
MAAGHIGGTAVGAATEFYCEHSASKSRVLALVKRGGCVPSLHAVLTCTDPLLAHRVASSLREAAESGRGPAVAAEAERVAALLPEAPAASYRQALDWVLSSSWPISDAGWIRWDQLHDSYGYKPADDEPVTPGGRDGERRTPSAGSVTELPGSVIRIVDTLDLHIHDQDRLLAAARADGWEPDNDTEDPHDLLDAAMWLADQTPNLPGADVIRAEADGAYVTAAAADLDDPAGPDGSGATLPNFATLFPIDHSEDAEWQLTPRTADALHSALCTLADEAYDDIEEHGDQPVQPGDSDWSVFDRLPRLSWRQDAQWRRQVARAADDLTGDLEAGQWPIPRCNAEELCLHLAVEDADGFIEDRRHVELPKHDNDYDWGMCSEVMFQDHDVLLLDEGWADGIEDPDTEVNKATGIGDLRPHNWFRPFNNVEPRDPDRGFRR